ncbi:MAG: T9SS type A sorting domain-containing protein [Bacteroidia bacterium]|nr:T9SS type A sorting domain-containing protein [Bacteroidia bacterium]
MRRANNILLVLLSYGLVYAQGTGNRFQSPVFSQLKVTKNVLYGNNVSFNNAPVDLYMDVYEPIGDTMARRPVIILFHSGSFLPPSFASAVFAKAPIGTREDSGIVALCIEFARRGYVAISADHRVGWNPQATTQELRAQSIIQAVWRAVQDARALVRYLRKDAATTNQWRIDPNRIAMGGSSSGAYIGLHVAYLNLPSEFDNNKFKLQDGTMFVDTTQPGMDRGSGPNQSGNAFEGGSGHPGYPSHIQAVLNLGGALGDTSFVQNENVPVISLHGVQDPTTPYTSGIVLTAVGNYPIIEVFGSYSLTQNLIAKGNQTALLPDFSGDVPFPGLYPLNGAGFEPFGWYSSSGPAEIASAKRYVDTIIWFSTPRLFKVLNLPTIQMPVANTYSISQIVVLSLSEATAGDLQAYLSVYPNPATLPSVTIESPTASIREISLYRLTGERVLSRSLIQPSTSYLLELPDNLSQGMYLLRVETDRGIFTERLSYMQP